MVGKPTKESPVSEQIQEKHEKELPVQLTEATEQEVPVKKLFHGVPKEGPARDIAMAAAVAKEGLKTHAPRTVTPKDTKPDGKQKPLIIHISFLHSVW